MSEIHFRQKFPWAICPEPFRHDVVAPTHPNSESFRWLRRGRRSQDCGPYRLAEQLGWVVRAPIDVMLEPIRDLAFNCPEADLEITMNTLGIAEAWKRDEGYIGLRDKLQLRAYDFRVGNHWEVMFLPNGEHSLEWRLGFEIESTQEISFLVQGLPETEGFTVMSGILTDTQLAQLNTHTGFSVAIRPDAIVHIKRGQVLARLVALDQDSLKLNLQTEEASGKPGFMT